MKSLFAETDSPVVVLGGGGFIGGWLLRRLAELGFSRLRAVDIKKVADWHQIVPGVENLSLDLCADEACRVAMRGMRFAFNLASDMGGIGFIETHKADCMVSVLINTQLLRAAVTAKIERYFFSSSACVYAADRQAVPNITALREEDAYPAMPEDGYGWEKLFSERMCRHFTEDYGVATRVARYHNIYGPVGDFSSGREKAPAAICRKVVEAKLSGRHEIEIWGDGEQTRSFTFIDDCLHGTLAIMASDVAEPLNLGSSEMVTINRLVDIVERIAGVTLARRYRLDAPKGVRGRNSDNTRILRVLGWEPRTRLEDGLAATYAWIYDQMTTVPAQVARAKV